MMNNNELIIKDFGPIKDARIVFEKFTILIGKQGSGKSTVAKLYSLFTWIEKAITRHQITTTYLQKYSRFKKKYCSYNNLDSYFTDSTYLSFHGLHYEFVFENDTLSVNELHCISEDFNIAKVMYVPAERNILGCVDHPSGLKGLTSPMMTFLDEYDNAKIELRNGYKMPFDNVRFMYDKLNDMPWMEDEDYKIKLSTASSGYQSTLPLLLVSRNLSRMVLDKSKSTALNEKELKELQKDVEKIVNNDSLSDEVKNASLRTISARYKYTQFVNIVEEMELNLFPDSQKGVLYELIADANLLNANRLLLTTHSPYVLNYVSLSVKASQLHKRANGDADLDNRISSIVPENSMVDASRLYIYEMEDGYAQLLDNYQGVPSDDNFLNNRLDDANELYDVLMEVEEDMDNDKRNNYKIAVCN